MSFKAFDSEDVVISAESITSPLWTGDVLTLTNFYTSSTQKGGSSGEYYYDVYQQDPALYGEIARTQFSIAYADKQGSGSIPFNTLYPYNSPSSVIYGQYRNLVLGDENTNFSFGGVSSEFFYVLNIDRERYKEKLLPGAFNLILTNPGTGDSLSLIDDSINVSTVIYADSGRVFELISGSVNNPHTTSPNTSLGYTAAEGSYGKFLPDIGIVLLTGNALTAAVVNGGLNLPIDRSPSIPIDTNLTLLENSFTSIRAQSEETISSNFIFVRARNSEFNYSTNPSNISGSGELRYDIMINSPQSYVTAVGLYNNNLDLLAVAKLSRPLLKDFTKEALIRIKLDY